MVVSEQGGIPKHGLKCAEKLSMFSADLGLINENIDNFNENPPKMG